MLAAFLVIALHRVAGDEPVACVTIQALVILTLAGIYMRVISHEGTIDHALFVGASWLVLAIVIEIAMTARTGQGWYELLGSPASALRNVLMFTWILAPALFARRPK
jgi:hypothetical protein